MRVHFGPTTDFDTFTKLFLSHLIVASLIFPHQRFHSHHEKNSEVAPRDIVSILTSTVFDHFSQFPWTNQMTGSSTTHRVNAPTFSFLHVQFAVCWGMWRALVFVHWMVPASKGSMKSVQLVLRNSLVNVGSFSDKPTGLAATFVWNVLSGVDCCQLCSQLRMRTHCVVHGR